MQRLACCRPPPSASGGALERRQETCLARWALLEYWAYAPGGLQGLIVYNLNGVQFKAYDRLCPGENISSAPPRSSHVLVLKNSEHPEAYATLLMPIESSVLPLS